MHLNARVERASERFLDPDRTLAHVLRQRPCSRPQCREAAVATLTYVYADQTAVLGPLATRAEPHCYDLCDAHAQRLTAPRGGDMVRLQPDPEALRPSQNEISALADLVRGVATPAEPAPVALGNRGHLRVLRST